MRELATWRSQGGQLDVCQPPATAVSLQQHNVQATTRAGCSSSTCRRGEAYVPPPHRCGRRPAPQSWRRGHPGRPAPSWRSQTASRPDSCRQGRGRGMWSCEGRASNRGRVGTRDCLHAATQQAAPAIQQRHGSATLKHCSAQPPPATHTLGWYTSSAISTTFSLCAKRTRSRRLSCGEGMEGASVSTVGAEAG